MCIRDSPYTAEAATEVEICTFSNAAFERLVGEYPGLQSRLFQHTLDELDAARDWMLLLGRKSAREKVASLLLMIARRSVAVGCLPRDPDSVLAFDLPLSRTEIADCLGLTIETVSRQLKSLKDAGVIALPTLRHVELSSLARLEAVAEQSMD